MLEGFTPNELSVAIIVGRRYNALPCALGIQFISKWVIAFKADKNSSLGTAGMHMRSAERLNRSIFKLGRNNFGVPSGPTVAFMPSKIHWQYCRALDCGSSCKP